MLPRVTTRKLLPSSRHDLPEWEVKLGGRVIGWIKEAKIGRSSSVFYRAIGVLDGKRIDLELSTSWDNRLAVVVAFDADPLTGRRHLIHGQQQSG